jgi:D-alanyl-D-alanine carboxypeptidase/D-alanyl-D-alanine-endopeptidase (penicillin-binding protein 4)
VLALARGHRLPLLRLLACLLAASALLALEAPASHALGPDALRARLARDMGRAGTLAGAYVQDLGTGAVLYARKDTVARPPASVEKLYTTSTALLRFGPDAGLRTRVMTAGVVDELGVLRGDLYLRGGGDPTLSQAQIAALASAVASQTGIVRVDGSVLGDETLFDARRGAARTAFAFDRDIGGVLSGLAVGRGFARDGAPAKEAARRLAKALRSAGVPVDGPTGVGPAPAEAHEIAGVDSPPMSELARLTNVPSDNFDAEMLLKALGAAFGGAGTTPAGAAVVRQQLSVFGVQPQVVDGSGLSRSNRTSPRQVVRLLAGMHTQEEVAPAFEGSLAVVGRTGTVRRRMRGTPAQDRCRAKTGTLRAVSALAGYCLTTAGRPVAFAMLMSTRNITRAHAVQDRMTAAIATYGS